MAHIALTQGLYAIVDAEDLVLITQYRWYPRKDQWATYATTKMDGKTVYMHRMIMQPVGRQQIDHINGDGLDNRRANLRIATSSQQAGNAKSRKPRAKKNSRYRGVSWAQRGNVGYWRAELQLPTDNVGHRKRLIRYFPKERDAAECYNAWATAHYGTFAKLNVIEV